jgi:hypothetical protein
MANSADVEDRKLTLRLFAAIVVLVAVVGALLFLIAGPTIADAVAPGLGLRSAALIAFVATLIVMVVMAIAAGDGLLGEIQFMLAAFAGFFVVSWLLLAWVF